MSREIAILTLIVVCTHAEGANADVPALIRSTITTQGDLWVGQRIILAVDLLSPTYFAGAPAFDLPAVPGAILLEPADRPTVGTEQVGDVEYTTQRHELALFAQCAGTIRIPAFVVRFASASPPGQPSIARRLTTEPLNVVARMPPGAEGLSTILSTSQLTVDDSWKPEPRIAQLGDAFVRTLTIRAVDILGMAIPAPRFDRIPGLGVYRKEPMVSDATERGALIGSRTDVVTYVCEKAGTFTVPGGTLTWWDLDARALKRESLPARTFAVRSVAAPTAERSHSEIRRPGALLWVGGVLAGVALLTGVRVALRRWPAYRVARDETEPAFFGRFRRACRAGDPRAIHRSLLAWLDRSSTGGSPPRLDAFAAHSGDPELVAQIDALQASVFGTPDTPATASGSAASLARRVARARRRLRSKAVSAGDPSSGALAPLNPI